ncbi:MAG: hypothetical protein ACQEXJ_20625 [Myxococcota bacterium]
MPQLIEGPTRVTAAGAGEKTIDEYVGRVNNAETRVSVAHMKAPGEWSELCPNPLPVPAFAHRFGPICGVAVTDSCSR